MKTDTYSHWRDSARQPRFFLIDARAAFPVLLCLFHLRVWTISIAIAVCIALGILDYFKIPLMVGCRIFRHWVCGNKKLRE